MAEQLMDTLSNKEHERLLLMNEHAIAPPLTPAAQAVLDATDYPEDWATRIRVAAALRAVADQVVPWQPEPTEDSVGPTIDYGYCWALFSKANDVRQELIAIADELEGL